MLVLNFNFFWIRPFKVNLLVLRPFFYENHWGSEAFFTICCSQYVLRVLFVLFIHWKKGMLLFFNHFIVMAIKLGNEALSREMKKCINIDWPCMFINIHIIYEMVTSAFEVKKIVLSSLYLQINLFWGYVFYDFIGNKVNDDKNRLFTRSFW